MADEGSKSLFFSLGNKTWLQMISKIVSVNSEVHEGRGGRVVMLN
jgi:hypothetical protein